MAAVRHLHRRRIGVAVGGDHLHPQPLQLDGHFLAQLARTEQQDAGGVGGQRGSDADHGWRAIVRAAQFSRRCLLAAGALVATLARRRPGPALRTGC